MVTFLSYELIIAPTLANPLRFNEPIVHLLNLVCVRRTHSAFLEPSMDSANPLRFGACSPNPLKFHTVYDSPNPILFDEPSVHLPARHSLGPPLMAHLPILDLRIVCRTQPINNINIWTHCAFCKPTKIWRTHHAFAEPTKIRRTHKCSMHSTEL